MAEPIRVERRRQFCLRCGEFMFEFFCSPDGHFGLAGASDVAGPGDSATEDAAGDQVRCPTCGAGYRLLDKLSATGAPIVRH